MIQTTSLKAYQTEITPQLGARQKVVLEAFKQKENFTNLELAQFLQFPINTVVPRVFELRQKGFLKQHSVRRCHVSGRTAIAWTINREPEQLSLVN